MSAGQPMPSAFAGLFWFTPDYSGFEYVSPHLEFFPADLASGSVVTYNKTHRQERPDTYSKTPRGRVDVFLGTIYIFVDPNCPGTALERVIKEFRLCPYRSSIEVVYDPKRGIGGRSSA